MTPEQKLVISTVKVMINKIESQRDMKVSVGELVSAERNCEYRRKPFTSKCE